MEELNRLIEAVAVLQAEQARIKADVAEIKADVKALMLKPARRWDSAAEKALLCLVSAVIAAVLSRIGLS